MKLRKVCFKDAGIIPLTEDDVFVLETIYGVRLRLFVPVLVVASCLMTVAAWPVFRSVFLDGDTSALAPLCIVLLLVFGPFAFVFYRRIWMLRRDIRSGVKYEIWLCVIGKKYFPLTAQYFLSLDDVDYMHHEVAQNVFESVAEGSYYPVYFARYSPYAFNLRARFTGM